MIDLGVAIITLNNSDTKSREKVLHEYCMSTAWRPGARLRELKHTRNPTLEGGVSTSQIDNFFDLLRRRTYLTLRNNAIRHGTLLED